MFFDMVSPNMPNAPPVPYLTLMMFSSYVIMCYHDDPSVDINAPSKEKISANLGHLFQ